MIRPDLRKPWSCGGDSTGNGKVHRVSRTVGRARRVLHDLTTQQRLVGDDPAQHRGSRGADPADLRR